MFTRIWIPSVVLVLGIVSSSQWSLGGEPSKKPHHFPSYLTPYDIATPEDLRLARYLKPFVAGDSATEWPILKDVAKQLGDWVTKYFDAIQIASAAPRKRYFMKVAAWLFSPDPERKAME